MSFRLGILVALVFLSWGGFGGVGQGVGENGHYGGVFVEVFGVYLVKGVGGGVVVVEVVAAVLDGGEAGDAFFSEAADVFSGAAGGDQALGADCIEYLADGAKPFAEGWFAGVEDARRVVGAEVALDGADVVGEVVFVVGHVLGRTFGAFFFAHPGDAADGAFGVDAELLEEMNDLHGDDHAGAVVDCAGAEVPGVEMAGNDDNLLGVLGSLPVGDDIVAVGIGEGLRGEGEVQLYRALGGEIGEHVGVFSGDGGSGDFGDVGSVFGEAGVGEAVVGAANGADEDGDGSDGGTGDGACAAVDDSASVGFQAFAFGSEFLVELVVEEQDFAIDCAGRERGELLPVADDDDFGIEAVGRRGHAAAERGEHYLLGGSGRLAGPGDDFGGFSAADPVGDFGFFESDFSAESAHLGGNIFNGLACLGGTGEPRADVVSEVTKLVEGVGIFHGRVAKFFHDGELLGLPGALAAGDHGIEAVKQGGGRRRSLGGVLSLGKGRDDRRGKQEKSNRVNAVAGEIHAGCYHAVVQQFRLQCVYLFGAAYPALPASKQSERLARRFCPPLAILIAGAVHTPALWLVTRRGQ